MRLGLLQLLLLLYREWDPSARWISEDKVEMGDLARVIPAVRPAYSDNTRRLSLEDGAAVCGMSVSRFGRLFRRVMGITFPKFSLRVRTGYVTHLLRDTDLPLDAVAAAAGFSDASHLHRLFVQMNRCTPGQYRRTLRSAAGAGPSDT